MTPLSPTGCSSLGISIPSLSLFPPLFPSSFSLISIPLLHPLSFPLTLSPISSISSSSLPPPSDMYIYSVPIPLPAGYAQRLTEGSGRVYNRPAEAIGEKCRYQRQARHGRLWHVHFIWQRQQVIHKCLSSSQPTTNLKPGIFHLNFWILSQSFPETFRTRLTVGLRYSACSDR